MHTNTKKLTHWSLLTVCLLAFVGCQSYTAQNQAMSSAWQSGNIAVAVEEQQKRAEGKEGSKDELLVQMELGTVLLASSNYEESIAIFDAAEAIINDYEEQAKLKVGSEAAAMFSNQAALPYRGQEYEKIMVNTYKALGYLHLGETDSARVELNRALNRQQNAVALNQKRIEEAMEAAEKASSGELNDEKGEKAESYNVQQAKSDPRFASATDSMLSSIDAKILPYADYVNPFTVFLDGLFFSHTALTSDDIERARKSFERVKAMSPSSYIEEDLAMVESQANGVTPPATTYVIYSAGSAPTRDEIRIDIPLFVVSTVSYAGASFPKLEYHSNYYPSLQASLADGNVLQTELVSSMDSVVSKDFKNAWPAILTKTLISSGVKATAGYLFEKSLEGQDWKVRLLAKAANIGAQAATNKADLRSWTTLPKSFSYLRLPTPENGVLKLSSGYWSQDVSINPGETNVIYVRSINDVAPPMLSSFTL